MAVTYLRQASGVGNDPMFNVDATGGNYLALMIYNRTSVTTITYAGVTPDHLHTATDGYVGSCRVYGLKNPAQGSNVFAMTCPLASINGVCAVVLSGVDLGSPEVAHIEVGNAGSVNHLDLPLTTTATNQLSLSMVAPYRSNFWTPTGPTALQYLNCNSGDYGASVGYQIASGGVQNQYWSGAAAQGYSMGLAITLKSSGGGYMSWWFYANKWKDFLRDVKRGLVPPGMLRRQYQDLIAI